MPEILQAGDTALTVNLADITTSSAAQAVAAMSARLHGMQIAGIAEIVPALASLTVYYDPLATSSAAIRRAVEAAADALRTPDPDPPPSRMWLIPACYHPEFAPDLDEVARHGGLHSWQAAALHACVSYRVYMLGFLPGYPYMGELPPPLQLPRRATPRTGIPAGSVAVAADMTAIYPQASPGGWHIIARTPVALFDPARSPPALLAPGDEVRFEPIEREAYDRMSAAAQTGALHLAPLGRSS